MKNGYFGDIIFQKVGFFEHLKCTYDLFYVCNSEAPQQVEHSELEWKFWFVI